MSIRVLRNTLALFVLALLVAPQSALAREGFQPVSPEELKMSSEPLAPGAQAIILRREVERDDNKLTPHEDNYFRIKILKDEGRRYADIEISYYPEHENVVNVHGRTIKPDGTILNFDGKVFDKALVRGRGTQYAAKTFTLPDVEVGAILEYYYTIDFKEFYVYESHWILSQELFTKSARFSLKPYQSAYNEFNLRWNWQGLPPGVQPKQGPQGLVEMEASNIAAFQIEDHMPPPNELRARVDFIYEKGIFETDPDKFWKRVGKERNGQLESFVNKRKAMEEAINQIISPNDPPELKLRKIYDRVQKLRNTSYELEKTEQEESRDKEKAQENVEDVWKRGHGSGQQITWLYLALVRAAGFDAYGCWVSDRSNYFFTREVLQSGKLNASVVLVKLNGQDLYFDPGAAFTPFGLLTWSETGTPGLKLDKDGGTWIVTTLPHASESRIERKATLTLSDTGDLAGKLTVTATGLEAMYRRLNQRHADDVARKKSLEDWVERKIPVAAQAELTNKPDWNSSEDPLVMEFDIKIPGWASSAGKRVLLPVGIFTASEKHIFEHADRIHPAYFEYPYEDVDDVTIVLPSDWQVASVPAAQNLDRKLFAYSVAVQGDKTKFHVNRKLSVDAMFVEPEYYPALRNFFQTVRTGDEEQVVVQPGMATASK